MQNVVSDANGPIQIPARVYLAYFLAGAAFLFLCLFPPVTLSRLMAQLPWNPSAFSVKSGAPVPTPAALSTPEELKQKPSSASTCYTWTNLSEENVQQAKTILVGNSSISGVQFSTQPSKVGLAVVMPADLNKRTALTKILAENKIDVSNVVVLSNGNRAWAVGVFATEAMASEVKSSLVAKGAWNLVTEARAPLSSVQFSTATPAIVDTLNAFSKQRDWPTLSSCN